MFSDLFLKFDDFSDSTLDSDNFNISPFISEHQKMKVKIGSILSNVQNKVEFLPLLDRGSNLELEIKINGWV
jgi:hypothetical protein